MPIKTTLSLRKADANDIESILEWSEDSDFACTFLFNSGNSRKERRLFLARKLATMARAFSQEKLFMVKTSNNHSIGEIYFHNINWRNQNLVIEHHIDHDYYGSPVIPRILSMACDYAYFELNMNKILSYVHSSNAKALNFSGHFDHHEAVLKNYICTNGNFYDLYIFAAFREERLQVKYLEEAYQDYGTQLLALKLLSKQELTTGWEGGVPAMLKVLESVLHRLRKKYNLPQGPMRLSTEEKILIDTEYEKLAKT